MKTFLGPLLALGLLTTTFTQAQSTDDLKPFQTKTFSGISAVQARTSGGSLSVEGGSGNETKVEMYVRPNNWNGRETISQDEIQKRLEDYEISIRQEGKTVIATARRKNDRNDWKRALSIGFKFYTPRNTTADLETSGGSLRLAHLTGNQKLETSGGSIRLDDVRGTVNGETSGGSIQITNCHDQITLETSGGSIEATDSDGTLRLETSGGSIRLNGLKGNIVAQTSGGSVQGNNIDGELKTGTSGGSVRLRNIAGSVETSTSAGSIELEMTRVDKYVRVDGSVGSVRVKLPMNKGLDLDIRGSKVVSGELRNFDGQADKDRIKGRVNGGGARVEISASMGSVYLNQQ
ncbi:hypothetical protein F5984_11285 [Rudanella paleaurantiibacter]|uniref:DUF4097 family beta strand repeat protein n=1 Tax=Rudanella paleaurantiibacter TaxID=2614655 RepID=A0A7J5U123_9BACT|nr:hypothetical protein [Rudanella paleaurantiibacter]KAB7731369.1 hypothetical protein F5984_11285 [Rudanella paleaurantiibacter]